MQEKCEIYTYMYIYRHTCIHTHEVLGEVTNKRMREKEIDQTFFAGIPLDHKGQSDGVYLHESI